MARLIRPSRQASRKSRLLGSIPLLAALCASISCVPLANHVQAAPARAASRSDQPPAPTALDPKVLDPKFKGKLPITELSEDEAVLHALNRLGYGPRPGDIARIEQMGLEKWVDQQLHPETIDDSPLQARLQALPAVGMDAKALLDDYPQPNAAAKRMGITEDEYRKRMDQAAHPAQGLHPAPNHLPQEMLNEMEEAKVLRAIYSERQLEAQLSDFWFNHFNVFANKDLDLWLLPTYERDTIRPHVLGKFRVLLEATAKSPAMLFYLDNYVSANPHAFDRAKHAPPPKKKALVRPSCRVPPNAG